MLRRRPRRQSTKSPIPYKAESPHDVREWPVLTMAMPAIFAVQPIADDAGGRGFGHCDRGICIPRLMYGEASIASTAEPAEGPHPRAILSPGPFLPSPCRYAERRPGR